MKLIPIEGNTSMLDGGAMFGNAPREMWKQWMPPDEFNRILLATRCLLVQTDDGRNILMETGIGLFFEPKLRERFGLLQNEHMLLKNLAASGISENDIDIVILSHLHFDHAGGLLPAHGEPPRLLFPNAHIYTSKRHWAHANQPPMRERASFIPELLTLLSSSDRFHLIDGKTHPDLDFGIDFQFVDGHTVGLMISTLTATERPVTFISDLCPGMPWVHLPITMGYDRFPELLMTEKQVVLDRIIAENGLLFFTHDPNVAFAEVSRDAKDRYVSKKVL